MDTLEKQLKEIKPDISQSSVKTYKSLLKGLFYKFHAKNTDMDIKWFDKQDDIIEALKDKTPSSRKTYLSALLAVTNNNDKYKSLIGKDIKHTNDFNKTQEKTETQEQNWKDYAEIKSIYDNLYSKVKPLLNSKNELDKNDFMKLVDFMVMALTTGIFFPPRRSQDWVLMKFRDYDENNDNYYDAKKSQFVFNKYKTAKVYDTQKVDIPKEFKTILNKYIKHNKYVYLILNNKYEPYTTSRLTQKLNDLIGTKISTSMLRHIYLSDKLKDIPKLTELTQLSQDMGHSVSQQLEYIKK